MDNTRKSAERSEYPQCPFCYSQILKSIFADLSANDACSNGSIMEIPDTIKCERVQWIILCILFHTQRI